MALVDVPQISSPLRDVQRIPPQRRGGGGGDDGGRRGRGPGMPEFPKDEGLHAFLVFTHDLLGFWQSQAVAGADDFAAVDEDDRAQLQAGWADFENQWGRSQD